MTAESQAIEGERIRSREKLAEWMTQNSFATGHGDTIEDLMFELTWQVQELRNAAAGGAKP